MSSRLPARLGVIVTALLRSLYRRAPSHPPRRIAVVHRLLLGDTLMLTPLLAKLRRQYPRAEIVITVPPAAEALFAGRPYAVRPLVLDPRQPQTVRDLMRSGPYDLALVPGDNRHTWLARAAGSRRTVAFSGDRPAWKDLMADELVDYPATPASWGDMNTLLIPGEAPLAYAPEQWPAPQAEPFARPAAPYALLHVGASTRLKHWPPGHWLDLAGSLRGQGLQAVLSCGPGEADMLRELDPDGTYPTYPGNLSLAQLWHLVAGAGLLVCPDTSVSHLGRLAGTPTVCLFGPSSPLISGPGEFWRDSPYRAVRMEGIACRDQQLLFRREIPWLKRCVRSDAQCARPDCMLGIPVQAVWRACRELLAGGSQAGA